MKAAVFHPAARQVIRSFPYNVRRSLGKAIWDLQRGFRLGMPLSKPIRTVAPGVEELRVRDAAGAYRAFYLARLDERVLVFHAFTKKTQKTPKSEISLAQRRLKEMLDE